MHASVQIGDTTVMASDGRCTGAPAFQGFSLSLDAAFGHRGQTAVRSAERRRPGADAAGQDVLRPRLRYGRRQVRRIVDGDQADDVGTAHAACRVHGEPGTPPELPGADRAGRRGARRARQRVRRTAAAAVVYTGRPGPGAAAVAIYINGERVADRVRLCRGSARRTRCSCCRRCRADEREMRMSDRLLVGTKKGLFELRRAHGTWWIESTRFPRRPGLDAAAGSARRRAVRRRRSAISA